MNRIVYWFEKIQGRICKRSRSYALNKLDLKLKPYLSRIPNGFFVEAGANNGVSQSNTLYFEEHYGWRGILIEPIFELAEQARKNRPLAIVERAALVSTTYDKPTIVMQYGDLMSFVKGGMKTKEEEERHIRDAHRVKRIETYTVETPAVTLTHILDTHGVKKIDFLSLDVEGYELEVLKGLDLAKYRPHYILVEARYKTEIDEYLARAEYHEVARLSHHDYLYATV